MKFYFFHLMPWPDLPADFSDKSKHPSAWVTLSKYYDPEKGHLLYNRLASDFGPMQEAQEFSQQAKEFLLWLCDGAREKYTDSGLAQQLRFAGRASVFFRSDDLKSCVVATASAEWIEQRRMQRLAIQIERKRLEAM